jgi:transcriptional regulator with XRE-family HTH domain
VSKKLIYQNIVMEIGKSITQLREKTGISQKELSEYIGIRVNQLKNYERGINQMSIDKLFHISRHFGKTLDFFVKEVMGNEGIKMNNQDEDADENELLTPKEILKKYGLSFAELEEMSNTPQFPRHYITHTGGLLYSKMRVEAFLKEKGKDNSNEDF